MSVLSLLFLCLLITGAELRAEDTSVETSLPTLRVQRKRGNDAGNLDSGSRLFVPLEPEKNNTVTGLLRQLPSIEMKANSPDENPVFLIRGQDPHQSRIFLEGIPLTDAQFNQSDIALIPPEMLSGAQVYPEAVPTFLMADGLGGAVDLKLTEARVGSHLSAKVGSFGYLRAAGKVNPSLGVPTQIGLEVSRSQEDFLFFDDNGTPFNSSDDTSRYRENNGYWRASVFPVVSWADRDDFSVRSLHLFNALSKDIAGPVTAPSRGHLDSYHLLNAVQLRVALSPQVNLHSTFFGRWSRETLELPSNTTFFPGKSENLALGARAVLVGGRRGELGWSANFGAQFDRYSREEAAASMYPARTHLPLGLQATIPVGALSLRPAVAAHLYSYSFSGNVYSWLRGAAAEAATRGRSYALFSPRLGLEYELSSRAKLRLAGARVERAPSLYELYGASSGILPSPELNPERAWKAETGIDVEWLRVSQVLRSVRASATVHVARAENLITFVQNSQFTQVATNVGGASVWGQELLLETQWPADLKLTGSASFLQTRNLSDIPYHHGKELPGRWPYRYRLAAAYEPERWGAGYEWMYYGPTFWDLANTKEMAGFSDHGLYVFYKTQDWGSFHLEGKNLLDANTASSYFDAIAVTDNNTGYQGYPAPGRRVYFTWRYDL